MKNCMLITPLSFYGWHKSITKELKRRGYNVELMNDEYPNNTLGLMIGNHFNKLARLITYYKFKKHIETYKKKYDLIIIFKGRGMSKELIELLSKQTVRIIAYNFDSFKYNKHTINWYYSLEKFNTFDFDDSKNFTLNRIDLFSDYFPQKKIKIKDIDISCIVKNHSDRLEYLDTVYSTLSNEFNFKVYIYEKNIFTYLKGFIKNPILFIKWRKSISFKSLNSIEYFKILESSKFTIDYAHPSQTGITMRCFQALACGTKIITNNENIELCEVLKDSIFYIHKLKGNSNNLQLFVKQNLNKPTKKINRNVIDFISDLLN